MEIKSSLTIIFLLLLSNSILAEKSQKDLQAETKALLKDFNSNFIKGGKKKPEFDNSFFQKIAEVFLKINQMIKVDIAGEDEEFNEQKLQFFRILMEKTQEVKELAIDVKEKEIIETQRSKSFETMEWKEEFKDEIANMAKGLIVLEFLLKDCSTVSMLDNKCKGIEKLVTEIKNENFKVEEINEQLNMSALKKEVTNMINDKIAQNIRFVKYKVIDGCKEQ